MSANNLASILPLAALALAFALRGGRESFAFAATFVALSTLPLLPRIRETFSERTRDALPFALLLVWCVVVLAGDPPFARHLYRFAQLAAYFVFLIAAATWDEKEHRRFLLGIVFIAATDLFVFLLGMLRDPSATGYLIGNPTYSGLLWTSAFLAAITLGRDASQHARLTGALFGLLLVFGLVLLRSRSSLIGLYAGLYFVLPRKRFVALTTVLALAAAGAWAIDSERVMDYLKIDAAQPHLWLGRLQIWKTALLAVADRPILGWGLGNFEAAYLQHELPVNDVLRFDRSSPFAHNDFLQLAAEAGLPALALFLWGLVRFWTRVRGRQESSLTWARAVVALFAVSALFNFTVLLPLCGLIAAAALGMAFSAPPREPRAGDRWAPVAATVTMGLLCVFLTANAAADHLLRTGRIDTAVRVMPLRADLWYASAMAALQKPGWIGNREGEKDVFRRLEKAVAANPEDGFAWNRLGVVAMSVMNPPVNARGAFERAVALAPRHAPFWIDLGFERLGDNDLPGARAAFNEAGSLEPNAPIPKFSLALASARDGNAKQARTLVNEAVALQRAFGERVTASGYSDYLFGLDEAAMRKRVEAVIERTKTD